MTEKELNELFAYAVRIRRQIHEYPEVGFELPGTAALVARELAAMGITPTDRYGTCSLVADIGQGEELVLLRADMDALPVQEVNELPYRSRIPGKMHACGHDSHTAILLAVAKYLKIHEEKLPCRVRLFFQPAEESAVSGAKMMMDAGALEGVSQAVCTHCDNTIPMGELRICPGDYMAACIPLTIRFLGKTSHATFPENGIDAIAMAVEAYGAMKAAVREEAGENTRYIWSVGHFAGGDVHNVIADSCQLDISFRFYDMDFAARVEKRIKAVCTEIAGRIGGSCEIDWHVSTGPVHNHPAMVSRFEERAKAAGLFVGRVPPRMSSEDFGWVLSKVPGFIFRFGTRNEALGCTEPSHTNTFMIDENGMKYAISAFIAYLLGTQREETA